MGTNVINCHKEKTMKEKKWVYGTRTGKWYLIDSDDRDYTSGITESEMEAIGKVAAKIKYFSAALA